MKISFIIPSHNCVAWLPHAIDSAQKQTIGDVEIVVVNDGSTDSTKDYLDWLKQDERVIIINTNGVGRSIARNLGNASATGEVLFVLDADDIASPDRVSKTLRLIQKGAKFVYGGAEVMDFSGRKIETIIPDVFNLPKALEKKSNGIVHSTVAYTKEIAHQFPYSIDKEISDLGLDDWEQQLRIANAKIPMDFVPTSVCGYRILQSAISRTRDENKVLEVKQKHLEKLLVVA